MDERRFDELTKALAAAKPSRREALRRLAGGALATVVGGLALEEASARRVGTEARTCDQVCNGDAQCNFGLRCGAGSGRCIAIPDSKTRCNSNGECPERYETCNRNDRCINTLAPTDCPDCRENNDCAGANTICSNDRCIERECTDNSDCSRRKRCRQGRCVRRD